VPYEDLVARAAHDVNLPAEIATKLIDHWDKLAPWPEARHVVSVLQHTKRIGVVTNCSEVLAQRAVARVGVEFDVLVSAERAGYYKPRAEPYTLALSELGLDAGQVVYVAGSPYDVEAPAQLGMRVVWHDRAGLRVANAVPAGVKVISNLSELLL
jgi:2-haloalkanoic acid dehalogenase type II